MASGTFAHPAGSDEIRIGVVGCGSRGTGAAKNCVQSSPNIKIAAIGDGFADKVESCFTRLKSNDTGEKTEWSASRPWRDADKVEANRDDCFVGFDAYKQVIAHPKVDLLLLTATPHFRPAHLNPLHGIPVILKDNIDTADRMTTTAGSLALESSIPERDSFLAQRLREAGAILLAKSNLSEWANFRSERSSKRLGRPRRAMPKSLRAGPQSLRLQFRLCSGNVG